MKAWRYPQARENYYPPQTDWRESVISPRDAVYSPREAVYSPREAVYSPRDAVISPRDAVYVPQEPLPAREPPVYVQPNPAAAAAAKSNSNKWTLVVGLVILLLIIAIPAIVLPIYYSDTQREELYKYEDTCEDDLCVRGECLPLLTGGFECKCDPGFTGDRCNKEIEEGSFCDHKPCEHGSCLPVDDGYLCICEEGYSGINCNSDINECSINNGHCDGSCINDDGGYHCVCPAGAHLALDEHTCIKDSACASNPCYRGTCEDYHDRFRCKCDNGFTGKTCEDDLDECSVNNGGCEFTCTNTRGGFECSCPAGQALSENMRTCVAQHYCASSPCAHGRCVESGSSFLCVCEGGYKGERCDRDVNECGIVPAVCDVYCTNLDGGFVCSCPRGEELSEDGHSCIVPAQHCTDSSCDHGRCIEVDDNHFCLCDEGYTGSMCNRDVNECLGTPRVCDGECTNTDGSYRCSCPPGQALGENGHSCTDIAECASNPCGIHGICLEGDEGFTCKCDYGWGGEHCTTQKCEAGWLFFEEHCYMFVLRTSESSMSIGLSQIEAEAMCNRRGGSHLVSINTDDEMTFIYQNILLVVNGEYDKRKRRNVRTFGRDKRYYESAFLVWTGLKVDSSDYRDWSWTDGSQVNPDVLNNHWHSGEFEESSGSGGDYTQCAKFDTQYYNFDTERTDVLILTGCNAYWDTHYICEKPGAHLDHD